MYDDNSNKAILNDFDLATDLSAVDRLMGQERTGTVPFMAWDLLSRFGLDGQLPRYYRHDLESLTLWVPLWLGYSNHPKLTEWMGMSGAVLHGVRLSDFPVDYADDPYFQVGGGDTNWFSRLRDVYTHWRSRIIDATDVNNKIHRYRMPFLEALPADRPSALSLCEVIELFGQDHVPQEVSMWFLKQDIDAVKGDSDWGATASALWDKVTWLDDPAKSNSPKYRL